MTAEITRSKTSLNFLLNAGLYCMAVCTELLFDIVYAKAHPQDAIGLQSCCTVHGEE